VTASPQDQDRDMEQRVRAIWDANAAFWDQRYGEGNDFQRQLIGPASERLLALQPGERVLEIACGNGAFARWMAELGVHVVAVDHSAVFLERARARTNSPNVEYRLVDATEPAQLAALGARCYDAAVCSMGLMDMVVIEPLLMALPKLLAPNGRFVFSVMHPCFNIPGGSTKLAEEEDREGEIVTTYALKITRYITPITCRGLGMIGQPEPQYYFHRPLSVLLGACFAAGFVLDGLEEPVFDAATPANRTFSLANYRELPPVLVARLRPLPI